MSFVKKYYFYFFKAGSLSIVALLSYVFAFGFEYLSNSVNFFSIFHSVFKIGSIIFLFLYLVLSTPFKIIYPAIISYELFTYSNIYLFEFIFVFILYGALGLAYIYTKTKKNSTNKLIFKLIFITLNIIFIIGFLLALLFSAVLAFGG